MIRPRISANQDQTNRFAKTFALIFGFALLGAQFGCQTKSSKTALTAPALRVGMELAYPPFETQDPQGKPDGVSVKLAEELATHLQRPLQIVPMEFSGLIPALKSHQIDLVISSMTATPERRQSIDFSDPYAFAGLALLVRADSTIRSIDDLRNSSEARVVVKSTTTGEAWATKELPQAQRTAYTEETACVQEVAQGRADAFIYDQLSIFRFQQAHASTTRALLKPFVQESWAIGIAQGQDALKQEVNGFLSTFRAAGGLERLSQQFLAKEKAALDAAGIPFILR